jgi:hypothetical protein
MFTRNSMQARNPGRRPDREHRLPKMTRNDQREVRSFAGMLNQGGAVYPEVPAGWPNRATRRAVKGNRMSRLSAPWKALFAAHSNLVAEVRKL